MDRRLWLLAAIMTPSMSLADNPPLLVRSSLAPASTVFVREFPGRNEAFLAQLAEICRQAGAELHVVPGGEPYPYNQVWLQDCVEFLERADGSGTVALLGNRNQAIDGFAKDRLPGVTTIRVGEYRKAFGAGEGGDSWIDWYGNLEASPPTNAYPEGRVLYGVNPATKGQLHPDVVAFITAQGRQPPLAIDVGWLSIRHVDEMSAFLPTAEPGGFIVAVPNPLVAISLLKKLQREGHGDAALLGPFEEGTTVASLLAESDFIAHNERLWLERIEPAADRLAEGIGYDGPVIGLPVLFRPGGESRTPNVVNCLVLPGRDGQPGHVAMSDPHGPVIDGTDAFQQAVRDRLAMVHAELHFVDDRQYHKWSGNVHCGTNAIRPLSLRPE